MDGSQKDLTKADLVACPKLKSRSFSRQITEVQLGRKVLNNNDRARTACVRTHLLTLRLGKGRIPFPSLSVQQG